MYHIMKGKVVEDTIRVQETFIIISTGRSSLYCRGPTRTGRQWECLVRLWHGILSQQIGRYFLFYLRLMKKNNPPQYFFCHFFLWCLSSFFIFLYVCSVKKLEALLRKKFPIGEVGRKVGWDELKWRHFYLSGINAKFWSFFTFLMMKFPFEKFHCKCKCWISGNWIWGNWNY